MTSATSGRFGAIVFIIIGVLALLIGAWQGLQTRKFLARAVAVTGHVVTVPGQESATMSSAHPMIAFTAQDGTTVRYRQDGMGARPIGAAVDLRYDPSAPADTATVAGFWTTWFPVVGPLILGVAFIIVPLAGVAIGLRGARP